jgi:hypothetical protein
VAQTDQPPGSAGPTHPHTVRGGKAAASGVGHGMPAEVSGSGGAPGNFDQYDWQQAQFWKQRVSREAASPQRAHTARPSRVFAANSPGPVLAGVEIRPPLGFGDQLRPTTVGMPIGRRWPAPKDASGRYDGDSPASTPDSGFVPPSWPRAACPGDILNKREQRYDLNHDGVLDHMERTIMRFDKTSPPGDAVNDTGSRTSSVYTPPFSPSPPNNGSVYSRSIEHAGIDKRSAHVGPFTQLDPRLVDGQQHDAARAGTSCELCRANGGRSATATFGVAGQSTSRWCGVCAVKVRGVGPIVRVLACSACQRCLGEESSQRPPRQQAMFCPPCAAERALPHHEFLKADLSLRSTAAAEKTTKSARKVVADSTWNEGTGSPAALAAHLKAAPRLQSIAQSAYSAQEPGPPGVSTPRQQAGGGGSKSSRESREKQPGDGQHWAVRLSTRQQRRFRSQCEYAETRASKLTHLY